MNEVSGASGPRLAHSCEREEKKVKLRWYQEEAIVKWDFRRMLFLHGVTKARQKKLIGLPSTNESRTTPFRKCSNSFPLLNSGLFFDLVYDPKQRRNCGHLAPRHLGNMNFSYMNNESKITPTPASWNNSI